VPFELKIPPPWRSQGWKVKVRDRERVEPLGSAEHRGLPEQLGSYVSGKSAGVEEARLRGR